MLAPLICGPLFQSLLQSVRLVEGCIAIQRFLFNVARRLIDVDVSFAVEVFPFGAQWPLLAMHLPLRWRFERLPISLIGPRLFRSDFHAKVLITNTGTLRLEPNLHFLCRDSRAILAVDLLNPDSRTFASL